MYRLMKGHLALKRDGGRISQFLRVRRRDTLTSLSRSMGQGGILRHHLITLTVSLGFYPPVASTNLSVVGYLAQIIQKIEENQFPSRLTNINPTKAYLQTAAHHAKTMDKSLRDAILAGSTDKVVEYLNQDPVTRANLRTTTAVDVIQGGVKCRLSNSMDDLVR